MIRFLGYAVLFVTVVALIVATVWVGAHNRLVHLRQLVRESWRDVDVELKRRHDLVPNLVEVVRAYAGHERDLIALLTAEREALAGPVAAVAERYPQLQASRSFQELQAQLVDTEDRLAAARRIHNANLRVYDTALQSFPSSAVARRAGFGPYIADET